MKYSVLEVKISELLDWIKKDRIDLHPPYQRNFVWTLKDQKMLINSIMRGYPLPNFIICRHEDGRYEMVDGQQRATTISKFVKNEFPDINRRFFKDIDQNEFLDYKLLFTVIENVDTNKGESLEEYFSLVNKRGVHLNVAEINQAQYHDAPFMKMVNGLMDTQGLSELDIFSSKTKQRMNDRSLVEELVAYLFKKKITEKRNAVDELLESSLTETQIKEVTERFESVIEKVCFLNSNVKALKDTRFKQRNDFYTLFVYIAKNSEIPSEVLKKQYAFLAYLDEKGFISPSNEDCKVLQDYAYHCVTQSNSKNAREQRLAIMEDILIFKDGDDMSERLSSLIDYLEEECNVDKVVFCEFDGYKVVEVK